MVDFHSHILPAFDDGSKSTAQTREMLDMTAEQGISAMVATPHFYAEREQPKDFLLRRNCAIERFMTVYDFKSDPAVYLGAEVAFFGGIGHCMALRDLTIVGTNYVLIEMPFCRWHESVYSDLYNVQDRLGCIPVIAHIERYIFLQPRKTLEKLLDHGCLIRSNGDFFTKGWKKRKAMHMLTSGKIHLLGSDCHNTTDRRQNLGEASALIMKMVGSEPLDRVDSVSQTLLSEAVTIDRILAV